MQSGWGHDFESCASVILTRVIVVSHLHQGLSFNQSEIHIALTVLE